MMLARDGGRSFEMVRAFLVGLISAAITYFSGLGAAACATASFWNVF